MNEEERPAWLDDGDVASLDAAVDQALELFSEGSYDEALEAMRGVFERAVVAPRLPEGWLFALAGQFERLLGTSHQAVVEAIAILRRAEKAGAPLDSGARVHALTLRSRFVHDVIDDDATGAAGAVAAMTFADETLAVFGDLDDEDAEVLLARLRRDRILAGIATREYPSSAAAYAGFETAIGWEAASAGVVVQRVLTASAGADFAADQDDSERAETFLATAEALASTAAVSERDDLTWSIRAQRVRLRQARGASADELLDDVEAFLLDRSPGSVHRVTVHGMLAETVGAALRRENRDDEARQVEDRLQLRFVSDPDPSVRAAAARWLRWNGSASSEGLTFSPAERDAMRRAVAAFEGDSHPEVRREVERTTLAWGMAESHLGDDRAAVSVLAPLVSRLRAAPSNPEGDRLIRRAYLALHLSHTALGEQFPAREALDALLAATPPGHPDLQDRAIRAKALYWRSRHLREQGHWDEFWPELQQLLAESAADSGEARQWASGALFSLWISAKGVHPEARTWAIARYAALFDSDDDDVIRMRNVARCVAQARDLREAGDAPAAIALLDHTIARFEAHSDAAVQKQVTAARDLRTLTGVLAAEVPATVGSDAEPTLASVDEIIAEGIRQGSTARAVAVFLHAADVADRTTNSFARAAGLMALNNATITQLEIGDIAGLITVAERFVRTCDDMLATELVSALAARVRGLRAQALNRWAVGLGKAGDRARARVLYSLVIDGADPAALTDDDHITAVSQAIYNRAVMTDDDGDLPAAVADYRRLRAAHRYWPDSVPRRVRQVKAARNEGAACERMGLMGEAADAYRIATDLSRTGDHPDLVSRRGDSLLRFADLGLRAGLADDVRGWLEWALGGGIPLSPVETRTAQSLHAQAAKALNKRR